jgi:hypothetical protein
MASNHVVTILVLECHHSPLRINLLKWKDSNFLSAKMISFVSKISICGKCSFFPFEENSTDDAPSTKTCDYWLQPFRSGNFDPMGINMKGSCKV